MNIPCESSPAVAPTAEPIAAAPSPWGTIAHAIRTGAQRLQTVVDNPRLEARLLLSHALDVTQNELIRDPGRPIDTSGFEVLLRRRMSHEPLALILGQREFWSMPFQVSRSTLIPRPDSETLVEAAVAACAGRLPDTIIDLGTGTGCLLLALLSEFRDAYGIGLDVSSEAASLAQGNAFRLGLNHRASFVVSDWTNAVTGDFDLLVSNPPYIRRHDIANLMPEVSRHEPALALDGGMDGYDAYRMIVPRIPDLLRPNGIAILELGFGQATYVSDIAREAGLGASIRLDLLHTPRAIVLRWPGQ